MKQDIHVCLAFQTGGCLLMHESSAESFLRYQATTCLKQFPCHLNGWSLKTGLTAENNIGGAQACLR